MSRLQVSVWTFVAMAALAVGVGCESQGTDGTSCSVSEVDGVKTIQCTDGTSITLNDGVDGTSCTATGNGDGTKTISCEDGTSITVSDGRDGTDGNDGNNGEGCTSVDNGDGSMTITCGETTVTIASGENGVDGTDCSVVDNGDGTKAITCGDTTVTVTDGADGEDVDPEALAQLQAMAAVGAEACAICHAESGEHHQAVYDMYTDESDLTLVINSVESVDGTNVGTYDTTLTFTITKAGLPFVDAANLPNLKQKRIMGIQFVNGLYVNPLSFGSFTPTATPGVFTAKVTGAAYAIEDEDAAVYAYIADEILGTEGMTLYSNVASAAASFNDFDDLTADTAGATVSGCEKCHGTPYMKHGYRAAAVDGLADFAACKFCHYDTRNGSHVDWQVLVDDPLRYTQIAETPLTDAEKIKYAYVANTMNDTHMSHAMEFAYPQSMSNCATCHEGKLDKVLTEDNFTITTCKSCHPVDGSEDYGTADLALNTILPSWHTLTSNCKGCHTDDSNVSFKSIHSGYDKVIYVEDGVKYSEWFVGSIDDAELDGNILTVTFSITEDATSTSDLNAADVVPTVMVGLYGWDTKDFIVSPHGRDSNSKRYLEFVVDGVETNPRFTTVSAANGTWTITADLSMWADLLADGTVKRAEIAIEPELMDGDMQVAMNAVSRTFDLVDNEFEDDFWGTKLVDVEGCNKCHDALATTFHSPDRGGSVVVCRMCHVTLNGGSHLEMQSRSIDSYVHAIHSFQPFDTGDIDMTDPVEKMHYEHHIESTYPNFTITNCESCHEEGMFNIPDNAKSMPGIQSAADKWDTGRNIGTVPSYITGPGSRACGGCHRAELINEDEAGELAAFNQHVKSNGYLVENVTGLWNLLVANVMSLF